MWPVGDRIGSNNVVVFIILDWKFVLKNIAKMIPCKRVSERKLVIKVRHGEAPGGRRIGLMVSELERSRLEPWPWTLYSHSASLHPRV